MSETFDEQQLIDLREAFSSVDYDNNGRVYTKDIPTIFAHLDDNLKACIMEEDELKRLLEELDLDHPDRITFSQFLTLVAYKVNVTDTVEELHQAFRMFDRTESGYISIDDLWRGMQHLGENVTKSEVEEMMREADKDLDGKITFAEFIEMIRYK